MKSEGLDEQLDRRVSAAKPEAAARLLELIQMRLVSEAIHVVATLGIADLLADAPKHVEQLAEATGASAPPLRRVLRALANFDIFSEDSGGRFALADLGEFLKSDVAGSLQSASLFLGGEVGSNSIRLLLESVMTGESAPFRSCLPAKVFSIGSSVILSG